MADGLLLAELVEVAGEGVVEVEGGDPQEYDGKDIVEQSGQVEGHGGLDGRGEEELGVELGLGDRPVGVDGEQPGEDGLELDVMGRRDAAPEVGGVLKLQRELDGARLVQGGGLAQADGGGRGLGLGSLVRQGLGGKMVSVLGGELVWDGELVVGGGEGLKPYELVVWKGGQRVLGGEGGEVWV